MALKEIVKNWEGTTTLPILNFTRLAILFLFFIGLSGCVVKHIWMEQPRLKSSGSTTYLFSHNLPVVEGLLNGVPSKFIVDFGADENLIWDTTTLFPGKNIISKKNVKGHSGKTQATLTSYKTLDFLDIYVKNPLFYEKYMPQFDHMTALGISGLISGKYYNYLGKCISLSNSELTLKIIDCSEIPSSYKKIKAKLSIIGRVYIYLTLENEREVRFKFDTGANLNLAMAHVQNENANVVYYGNIGTDIKGYVYDTIKKYITRLDFAESKIKLDSQIISETSSIKRNIMGMEFIQQFEWIIDYQNKSVYVLPVEKKNSLNSFPDIVVKKEGNTLIAKMINVESSSNVKVGDIVFDNKSNQFNTTELLELVDLINHNKASIIHNEIIMKPALK